MLLPLRASTLKLSHIWRTNIQTTLDGTERRRKLFSWPRISVEMDMPTGQHKAQAWMRANLFSDVDNLWKIPIWSDFSEITSTATGSTLPCDAAGRHFYVGRECIVINKSMNSWDDYETHTISGVSDDAITISGSLDKSWSAGHYVVPLYEFRTNFKGNIQRQVQSADFISMEGLEAYETARTFDYTPPASGTITYRDKELFLYKPTSPKEETYSRNATLQQYLGIGFKHAYQTTTGRKYEQSFLLAPDEAPEVLDFFDRHCGRYNTFWFPTWTQDIKPAAAMDAGDSVIYIEDIDYNLEWFLNDTIGRNIYIQFPDGSYVCRKILNATGSSVILNGTLGTSVSAGNLSKVYISFLELGRFDQDEIEMEYIQGRRIARTTLYLHGLINENDDYVPPPVSITVYPGVSGDDGYYYTGWNNNSSDLLIGHYTSSSYVFIRFPNVTVPQGATISEAYIRFMSYNDKSGTVYTKIYFNDVDNATAPTDWTTQSAKVKTTAVEDWDITAAWSNGSQYNTVDLSDIVQEVVDRGGWASGNAMMALIENDGTTGSVRRQASSIDYLSGAEKCELHITYNAE